MSPLFSMMRNDSMPASRILMPIQRPENPAPTISTSTFVPAEFRKGAAASVIRVSSLLCWISRAQLECGGTRRFLATIGMRVGMKDSRRDAIIPHTFQTALNVPFKDADRTPRFEASRHSLPSNFEFSDGARISLCDSRERRKARRCRSDSRALLFTGPWCACLCLREAPFLARAPNQESARSKKDGSYSAQY